MAQFRPAGMWDDDSDSDCGFYDKPVRQYQVPQQSAKKRIEIALQDAIISGNIREVEKIITRDMNNDVNMRLDSGWTALMHACFHVQEDIVEVLLERGADPNMQCDSVTPIMLTCSNSSAETAAMFHVVSALIDQGGFLNIGDKYGQTPLMRAIASGRSAIAHKLLESKVNIEMRDMQGWTAVFWAAHHNQREILDLLIVLGARLTEVDKAGRTALDIANSHEYDHIAKMLERQLKREEDEEKTDFVPQKVSTWQDFYPGINKGELITYSSEIPHLLYGMNVERLAPIIQTAGLDLRTFLLMDEKEMDRLGIDMPYERQRLRCGLRNFHLKGWKLNAVAGLYARKTENYSVLDCVTTLGSHLQQVYLLEATMQYTLREYKKVQNQLKFEPPDSPLLTRLAAVTKNMLVNINSIRREINNMKTALTKISRNNPPPADFIKEKSFQEKIVQYFSEAVVIATLGFFVYQARHVFSAAKLTTR